MARRVIALLLVLFLLSGCAPSQQPETTGATTLHTTQATTCETTIAETTTVVTVPEETTVPETTAATLPALEPSVSFDPYPLIDAMSTEQLVGQLFLARYPGMESLAISHLKQYALGGYILFSADFENHTKQSMLQLIQKLHVASGTPLLIAVDEEGGTVNRVSRFPQFRDKAFQSPRKLYAAGGMELLLQTEEEKCLLLGSLGINVNMAPVCDITTDPSAFMYSRSIGLSPAGTAGAIASMVRIMEANNIGSVLKHFPGYGDNKDTHTSIAVDTRTLEQLEQYDLIPFQAGIFADCDAILVSHTIVNALDSALPASLSPSVVAYMREKMGFDGVIVTDDLVMEAITDLYGTKEAAVMAVQAGCDLLCSSEYPIQYQAVLEAVKNGNISTDAIRKSVARILTWKYELGLLGDDSMGYA